MNKDIDLSEILKNCPRGAKFYSYIFGEETHFMGVSSHQGNAKPIFICGKYGEGQNFCLSRKGHAYADNYGECCIFPSKEQRDWSKFTAPWYNGGVNTEKKLDKNDVHYYVARDKGGILWLFMGKPIRRTEFFSCPYGKLITNADADEFSNYGLNVRDFVNLKWEDEPVEVFINLED